MKVERLLDKAITITPDAEETENLIPDNTYPPPYNDYVNILNCSIDIIQIRAVFIKIKNIYSRIDLQYYV